MKNALKIGLVVLVVATLAMGGVALALQSDEPAGTPEARPDAAARMVEILGPLVEDGTITPEIAEAVAKHLAGALPDLRPPRPRPIRHALDLGREAADFLDLEPAEVAEARRDGATLAELAVDNGSSGAALIEHLVEQVEDDLEQAVTDGRITEAEATEALERATEWITDVVNGDLDRPLFLRPHRRP